MRKSFVISRGEQFQSGCSVDQVSFQGEVFCVQSDAKMYLRCNRRIKDGKEHRYWNIVESKRCAGGKVVQRQVLYLGEINDSQQQAWCRVIEAFDEQSQQTHAAGAIPG